MITTAAKIFSQNFTFGYIVFLGVEVSANLTCATSFRDWVFSVLALSSGCVQVDTSYNHQSKDTVLFSTSFALKGFSELYIFNLLLQAIPL